MTQCRMPTEPLVKEAAGYSDDRNRSWYTQQNTADTITYPRDRDTKLVGDPNDDSIMKPALIIELITHIYTLNT